MGLRRIRKKGGYAYVKELEFDPNPLYAVEVGPDGRVFHGFAFDPRYGPDSQNQIDYHAEQDRLNTSNWKVGEPVDVRAAMGGRGRA